jgi:hypothetical protein
VGELWAKVSGEQLTESATMDPTPKMAMRLRRAMQAHHRIRDLPSVNALVPLRLNSRIISNRVEHLARQAAMTNRI